MRPPAPFIWIEDQPVDDFGLLAFFGSGAQRHDGQNRWLMFRTQIDVSSEPAKAELNISVDGLYQLFVNGTRIGRGPARASALHPRFDTYNVASHLERGTNAIGVLVHLPGVDLAWYETVKGDWSQVFGGGALAVWGHVNDHPFGTDATWRAHESDAWQRDVPRANEGLDFIEVCDRTRLPKGWSKPGFDDAAWRATRVLASGGGGPEGFFGGMETRPFPNLKPRDIAFAHERPRAPVRLVWAKAVETDNTLPLEQQPYGEVLAPLAPGMVDAPDTLVSAPDDWVTITTPQGHGVAFLFDFSVIHAGYPALEIDAQGGEIIDITASEHLPGEWDEGGSEAEARITRKPVLGLDAHMVRFTARPGRDRLEKAEWSAVRWVQITIRNAPNSIRIRHIHSIETSYPAENTAQFASSDPLLAPLWTTGRETLRACMHDGWVDCPSRERRQWLGDATVEYLVGRACFGPQVDALNAAFLRRAAESQRPDGLTQMFAPGDHKTNALIIPDWTLQWILNARNHLAYAGDTAVIDEIFPAIERALAWFENQRGPSGLVADMPYWHFMDWAGLGRAGEACALNAQLAGCLDAAAHMATATGRPGPAARYTATANRLRQALNTRHWDGTRGLYVDCVDPRTGAQAPRTSQHANAAMIVWGGAPQTRWPSMIAAMTDRDRLRFTAAPPIAATGDTVDEQHDMVMANTFYAHFVFEALATAGHFDAALDLIRWRYGPMLARGATTLWESFEPTASLCHGFSATPTYHMQASVLGVRPAADGFSTFTFCPQLSGLEQASGTIDTAAGTLAVSLRQAGSQMCARITVPGGMSGVAIAPHGWAIAEGSAQLTQGDTELTFTPAT